MLFKSNFVKKNVIIDANVADIVVNVALIVT